MSDSIKETILESIKWVKESLGFDLIKEDWGMANHKCTCALGCVLLKDNPEDTVRIEEDKENLVMAAEILGVEEEWADSFIEGFDSTGSKETAKVPGAWEMGQQIAMETSPVTTEVLFAKREFGNE